METIARAYVGFDRREPLQYRVTVESLLDHASIPVQVVRLQIDKLQKSTLYRRPSRVDGVQMYDIRDAAPCTTEFTYTRYLVPALAMYEGVALFCDSDFLFRADVAELFELSNSRYAVQCVKHHHVPSEHTKLRGQVQDAYFRKNWTSLMLWHCGHPGNASLTPWVVNESPRVWLHGLQWLTDDEIGPLPETWNWLEGTPALPDEPKAVHYTRGTPDMLGREDAAYAGEWRSYTRQDRAA